MRRGKTALILLLTSLLLVSLISCGNNAAPADTGSGVTTSETETGKPTDGIKLLSAAATDFVIVRSDSADSADAEVASAIRIKDEFTDKTGVKIGIMTDWYKNESDINTYEILVGKTNRKESDECAAILAKAEKPSFAVKMIGTKLVIDGTSLTMITRAADYFCQNILSGIENGELVLPADYEHIETFDSLSPADYIKKNAEYDVAMKKLLDIAAYKTNYRIGQGGCTDGVYAYFMLENSSADKHLGCIVKIDMQTWKILEYSDGLETDHSNDMTYNSKTNELIVVHNAPNYTVISIVDPATLKVVRDVTLAFQTYSITYNAKRDIYCFGVSGTYDFVTVDADFKIIKKFSGVNTGYVKQGFDSDDDYIYFLQYNPNCVYVFDWDLNYICDFDLPVQNIEAEHIYHIDDRFYVGFNSSGGKIYSMTINPKN